MGKSKNQGKKPGEAAQARKRHLQRQVRQEALIQLAAGKPATVMAYTDSGYKRFNVEPLVPGLDLNGHTVLTLREGKIWAAFYCEKDGKQVHIGGKHVPAGKIFGIVFSEGA